MTPRKLKDKIRTKKRPFCYRQIADSPSLL